MGMNIRKYFYLKNFRELKQVEQIIAIFSFVPIICYLLVALLLSLIAFFSLINAGMVLIHMFEEKDIMLGIGHGIHAILLTVIIIELFETVTIYLHTKHVPILILLMVGLTAMIRHALIFSFEDVQEIDIVATAVVMIVLICGIYILRNKYDSGSIIEIDGKTGKEADEQIPAPHDHSSTPMSEPLDHFPIQSGTDILIKYISYVPVICYIVTALFLSIIALASLFIAGEVVFQVAMGYGGNFEKGIEEAIYVIFLTVIIIGLFETVQAYLTSGNIPIYSLLVVGVTVTIRYILLFTLGGLDSTTIMAVSMVMVAFIAGLYLLHKKQEIKNNLML